MGYGNDKNVDIPLVSVVMLVYNHEKWLRQAIESILMQETYFSYELIIGEDCSTDNSRSIVKEYEKLYPSIIVPIFNEKNLGMTRNAENVWSRAQGKYVACCEGDDYWIDPHKLQKQVDFLENNSEYSAIFHSSKIVDEDNREIQLKDVSFVYEDDSDLSWENAADMIMGGQVASCMVKNPTKYANANIWDIHRNLKVLHGDHAGTLLYMSYGKIRRCHIPVSAYRRTYKGSSFNALSIAQDMHYYSYVGELEAARFLNIFAPIKIDNRKKAYGDLYDFWRNISDKKRGKLKNIKIMFWYNPGLFLEYNIKMFFTKLIGGYNRNEWLVYILKRNKRIMDTYGVLSYVILGTGVVGNQCYNFFKELGWINNVKAVWDNDTNKNGKMWNGFRISSAGQKYDKNTVIIVASRKYAKEMENDIKTMVGDNIHGVLSFDELVDEMVTLTGRHSLFAAVFDWLYKYELKWCMK